MDQLLLSRLQFAFTIGYHILWPAFTIGIAWFIVVLSALWLRTHDPVYRHLVRFWTKVFALAFGMGVVTGVVISYQLGLNWSGYARATADVIGPLFVLEVLTAFFLEAGFIGVMLYGEQKVGEKLHFTACLIVAIGTVISAFWIISANSWMQTPTAFTTTADGRFVATDFWGVVFNPSMPYRLAHMLTASFITGGFVVVGVSAFWIWRGRPADQPAARKAFSICLGLMAVLVPAQMLIGDQHGLNTRKYQPMKLAAIEARWDTARGVPINVIAWPDEKNERNDYALEIPILGSLILTHSLDGEVKGLKEVPASERPPVAPVFFAFRIMVGCGLLLLLVAFAGLYLRWRGRLYTARWYQVVCMGCIPLGFIATLAGWVVTEVGRQPYVIYGHFRTSEAVSPIAGGAVASSLAVALVLYNLLLLGFFWYAGRLALRGPMSGVPTHPAVPMATVAAALGQGSRTTEGAR
ncbi:Cytochrome bd ubiquinol oxidase, subunit I [Rhodopseudomonas palustris HaA2]|uniref:Cytochrome bd ubiquinol oxidase, subunit I n=1 Tax=Rhodopseudomonas palustris (strain HaA2) TaxID=316058 RepID=Q2J3P4_RHOP2|nr:cytochrome ubiquinol oxidase subunit I [Rhodopseudomonas palustris]ABD04916.1 Cytochrome bd ubiquinol oxidase, subunit I [Rhodopseudomonas palustris HaA2]